MGMQLQSLSNQMPVDDGMQSATHTNRGATHTNRDATGYDHAT